MTTSERTQLEMELDALKACIHCGLCLPACPTYLATGSEAESPRGRLYLMKKMLEGQLEPVQVQPHLDQCLACHGCETVCPSGVQYGKILLSAREDLAKQDQSWKRQFKRFIFSRVLPNHALLVAGGWLLRFYQRSGIQRFARWLGVLNWIPGLAQQEALLPALPHRKALSPGMRFGDTQGKTVALLTGCVMDIFYNSVHWDTIEVLVANGYQVVIPEQECCGALAHHAGDTDITRHQARLLVDKAMALDPDWIVVNSAGCGSTLKEYGHLLATDSMYREKAAIFSEKLMDVMTLLGQKPLAPFKNYAYYNTVTYHAACHLYHVQKVKELPIQLLAQVPGLKLVPLTNMEACCGSAGIFNVEHPELSDEILAEKMKHIQTACQEDKASTVVTGNPGCLLQLEKGIRDAHLPLKVQHPISILAEAYRTPGSTHPFGGPSQ